MRPKSPIRDIKKLILDILNSNEDLGFIEIKEGYSIVKVEQPLKKPMLTISRGKILSKPSGLQDYVGHYLDDDKFIEIRGKDITLKYEIHIWNNQESKYGGEDTIEYIKEILFEIFEFYPKLSREVRVIDFKDGDTVEDPFVDGLFHSRCVLTLRTLWTKEFEYAIVEEFRTKSEVKGDKELFIDDK